jgi:5-methylcytosine-specific restriction endonuclease McrA
MTARDHIGTALLVLVPISLFGGIILTDESPVFLVLGIIIAAVVGWIAAHLQEPRETRVSSIAAATLRNSVTWVDRQQQEYRQFYLTADWRYVRRQVTERDGNVCRRCNLQIQDPNELTIDHIKPRSKYPRLALVLSNLQVLCRRCNSSKGVD